jgi:hypothetical protein
MQLKNPYKESCKDFPRGVCRLSRLSAPVEAPTQTAKSSPELPDVQQRILLMLSDLECTIDDELFKRIGVSKPIFDYHIGELCRAKLIFTEPTYDTHSHWQLTQQGLAYLVEHGLVK